jgi:phenylacetate-CoA ligase
MSQAVSRLVGKTIYKLWDRKERKFRDAELQTLRTSQWLSRESLRSLQLRRLVRLIAHAYETVPFYRKAWGCMPSLSSLDDLSRLPLLSKLDVRGAGEALKTTAIPHANLLHAKTGGSTGTSLSLWFDAECQQARNAAAVRSDSWAGWYPGMWVGALWGSPPLPVTIKERIRNLLHDRVLYLDTMELRPETMSHFTDLLLKHRAEGLFGHSHSIYMYAKYIEERGGLRPQISSIVATSMMLLQHERDVIERVFACKVSNRYGCEEVGLIAAECEQHSGLHINEEHVLVEIVKDDGSPAQCGEEGRVVLTDLMNFGMPLIRYSVEDVAVLASGDCSCGRAHRMLEKIVGRQADFLRCSDGRLVAGVSLVEKTVTAITGLQQLQIVQLAIDRFTLNVVPGKDYSDATTAELTSVMRGVFGESIQVTSAIVGELPREGNSKYRFAICRI